MTYRYRMLLFLFAQLLFFVVNSQEIQRCLESKEPLDKFNLMASFASSHQNDVNAMATASEYVNQKGTAVDRIYFEYSVKRIQKINQKQLALSQQIAFLDSFIDIAQKKKDHFLLSIIFEHRAQTFRMSNEFAKALENYLYAADEASKDEKGKYYKNSFLFYEMGLQFFEFKDYTKSLKYGLISHQTKYHNDPNKAENWLAKANTNLIGESYRKLNQLDSASMWFKECIQQSQGKFTNDTIWQGIAISSFAGILYDQKKYDDALDYFFKSIKILDSLGKYLVDHNINTFTTLAEIYLQKNDIMLAKYWLNNAFPYLNKREFNNSALHYYKTLVSIYKKEENNKLLLSSLDSSDKYQQIVNAELDEKKKIRAEADITYSKQLLETQLINDAYKMSQIKFYGLMLISGLLAIVSILYIKRRNLRHNLQKQRIEQENERANEALLSAQKQLEVFAKNLQEKNSLIEQFSEEIETLKTSSTEKISEKEDIIAKLKQSVILTEDDWSNYKIMFQKAYPNFSENVKKQCTTITQGELRYLMFNKLNLSNKEMAALLGISLEAIRNLKFRVKQKIGDDWDVVS